MFLYGSVESHIRKIIQLIKLRNNLLRECFCMRGSSLLVVFVCFFIAVASLAFGQVGNGTITGTITDPTGAVVPGAKVDARSAQTGVHFAAASTTTGTYTITDLPVGSYTVTV